MPIRKVLDKLEDAERRFVGQEFLAPIAGSRPVRVRIAGVVCRLRVAAGLPAGFQGLAVLRSLSTSQAEFVRPAGLEESKRYLSLFPSIQLILIQKDKEAAAWCALPAQTGDRRFLVEGLLNVLLCEQGLERFETVKARFDGQLFWYERRDPSRDPAIAAYLRSRLAQPESDGLPAPAESLHKRGLSAAERQAYDIIRAYLIQASRDQIELRLAEALAHAGGQFKSYAERGDQYAVTYEVDGVQHVSAVQRSDLTIASAGICLSGMDRTFDLASLVGVLREARQGGRMIPMDDDD